jgi:nucleosome binding factor SPN SPT16 subunit
MLKKTAGLLLLMGLIAPLGGCPAADEGGETTEPAVEESPAADDKESPAADDKESPAADDKESSEDEGGEGGEGGEGN